MANAMLVSPVTHEALYQEGNTLFTEGKTERYPIVNGVPVLLTGGASADWHREIMEVLLWQYPEKINELYAKLDWKKPVLPQYIECIAALLKDKAGILAAVRGYSHDDTARWIISGPEPVPPEEIRSFKWRNHRKFARRMVKAARKNGSGGWAVHLPKYAELVHAAKPSVLLELSTGAGLGTSAVADKKARECLMYTMDIGYACHGNAVSIAKYLRVKDTLLPVCANFWHMPFADGSLDAVCSHFGLDESREIALTIGEVSRVLRPGGRFVNVSRASADLRSFELFEPFGFTREEMMEVCKAARLFSDTEALVELCAGQNLVLAERNNFQTGRDRTMEVDVTVFVRE